MSTYILDLDGTLCYSNPDGKVEDAVPITERITKINRLYEQGHKIFIDTARGTITGKDHFESTVRQLEKWGVKYHKLRTGIKLYGDFYIDDKAIKDTEFFK